MIKSMEFPLLLPKELEYTGSAKDDVQLLEILVNMPPHLITFFEAAADDQAWVRAHEPFMRDAIRWVTNQYLEDKLLTEFAKRIAIAIQKHFHQFNAFLLKNIAFKVDGETIRVNSLMWETASEDLRVLIRDQFRDQSISVLPLKNFTKEIFELIDEYIETGRVAKFWQHEKKEVTEVLERATEWGLEELQLECEKILERYITKDNVVGTLLVAHQKKWLDVKSRSTEFINNLGLGVSILKGESEEIVLEIKDFRETTLEFFEQFRSEVTHLKLGESLGGEPEFTDVISRCPKLRGLSLSGTEEFYPSYLYVPENLTQLDLSKCAWLNQDRVQQLFQKCPKLKRLNLSHNYQLGYAEFAELIRLEGLTELNISHCFQIDEATLELIKRAAPHLSRLIQD